MRIDGTYGLESHGAGEDKSARSRGAADEAARGGAAASQDLVVVSSQGRLIEAASACEDVNTRAVEEARALLAAGRLDTPEAARRAANAILDLGL